MSHCVQNGSSTNILIQLCLHNNLKILETTRPRVHLGEPQKHRIMTKSILCKIYREILFQKVALGYLLHFVHNGSSKNILNKCFCTTIANKNESCTAGLQFESTKKTTETEIETDRQRYPRAPWVYPPLWWMSFAGVGLW